MDALINLLAEALSFLSDNISWGINLLLIFIIAYLLFFPEKAGRIASWIYKGLRGLGSYFEKRYVASDIQSTINIRQRQINSEVDGALPYPVAIKWIREITPETFIENKRCVVRIHRSDNRSRNLVTATMAYIGQGVILFARRYIDHKVCQGIDLAITRSILVAEDSPGALDIFIEDILHPIISQDEDFAELYIVMESMDDSGFLTRILLREFMELGRMLYPKSPSDDLKEETRRLVKFLSDIARKDIEDVPLEFRGKMIHLNVVLVARSWKLEQHGLRPYVNRCKESAKSGADAVYICARGDNVSAAKEMASLVSQVRIGLQRRKGRSYKVKFRGEVKRAIVIPFLRPVRAREIA